MTLTKTLMLSAAAAAFLMVGGGAAWAQDNPCGLTAGQINAGHTCQVVGTEPGPAVTTYEQAGQSDRCKVFQQQTQTTTYQRFNQFNVATGNPIVGDPEPVGEPERDTSEGGTVTCPS